MKKSIEDTNKATKNLLRIIIILTILIILSMIQGHISLGADGNNGSTYLSDIPYIANLSGSSWKTITYDKNLDGGNLTLIVDGNITPFFKGVIAHANSTVVYDISSYNYDYFTSYIGVDASMGSKGNGVKFFIYTSTDGKNWTLKTEENPEPLKGNSQAKFIKIDIRGAKYLKLYANDNGGNAQDHSLYGNAKLIKEGYQEEKIDFIKTIEEYDEILKNKTLNNLLEENELTLLQREFVKNVGYINLQNYCLKYEDFRETISWLMNDLETLRLYIIGGKPDGGNYVTSIQILTKLLKAHKEDLNNTTVTKHGTVLGDLYKKMMITLSLTHTSKVALWMDPGEPENGSDPVTRYEIYKYLHANDKFVVSSRQDHTPWFESLQIEEMRYVLNNMIDDEEILWLNEYTQSFIDTHPGQEEIYLQPHRYMKYIWPNYNKPEYYAEENKTMWDAKYGYPFSKYGITYKPGVAKLWMNLDNGAVCRRNLKNWFKYTCRTWYSICRYWAARACSNTLLEKTI